jgi:hypothetical protein
MVSVCVCGGGGGGEALDPMVLLPMMQPFPMDGHYRTNVISGVDNPRSNSVVPLVLRMVCAMAGVPALYYKSLGTESTLLRMGNISSRPYR